VHVQIGLGELLEERQREFDHGSEIIGFAHPSEDNRESIW
jgi:hypothetical protein